MQEYAAIHLKVPMSGNDELDRMIRLARRLDIIQYDQEIGSTQLGMKEWEEVIGKI